jgi:DNA-directed RNA polymerase specialized sigma24 family protein
MKTFDEIEVLMIEAKNGKVSAKLELFQEMCNFLEAYFVTNYKSLNYTLEKDYDDIQQEFWFRYDNALQLFDITRKDLTTPGRVFISYIKTIIQNTITDYYTRIKPAINRHYYDKYGICQVEIAEFNYYEEFDEETLDTPSDKLERYIDSMLSPKHALMFKLYSGIVLPKYKAKAGEKPNGLGVIAIELFNAGLTDSILCKQTIDQQLKRVINKLKNDVNIIRLRNN